MMEEWVIWILGGGALCGLVIGAVLLWNNINRDTGNAYTEPTTRRSTRNPTPPTGNPIPTPAPSRHPLPTSSPRTSLQPTTWNGERVEHQLRLLKSAGYRHADLRVFDDDQNIFYIAIPCDKVTVHLIYNTKRPDSPPLALVSEKSTLNDFGEITDKQVDVALKTLAQWKNGSTLLDVVNEVRQNLRRGYTLNEHGEVIWRKQS